MSLNLNQKSSLVLLLSLTTMTQACGKKNDVSVPVPLSTVEEVVSITSDSTAESSGDSVDTEVVVSIPSGEDAKTQAVDATATDSDIDPTKQYASAVNNAVALLTGDEVLAQQGLEQLLSLNKTYPEVVEIQYNIGVAQLKLDNRRAAKKAFEDAIKLDATFGKAWVNLGILEEQENRIESAMAIYQEGLLVAENDPSLTARVVACLRKLERYDEAIAFAQEALKKNANNVDAYSEVGAVYLEKGDLEKALFVLQQAMGRSGGENANLQSVLGKVYYAQEKNINAEQAFRKALELEPTLIEAAMYLAFIQVNNRAWSNAQTTVQTALDLEADNAALLNLMGIVQRGLGNIDEAEKMYQQAYQLSPNNPEPLINLAVLEADYRNEYQKAFAYLDRYLAEGGENTALEKQWRSEFEQSEKDFIEEQKRREMRERFKRRQDAARKKAEEAKKAEEEAQRLAEEQAVQEGSESTEGADGSVETDGDVENVEAEDSVDEANDTNESSSGDGQNEDSATVNPQEETGWGNEEPVQDTTDSDETSGADENTEGVEQSTEDGVDNGTESEEDSTGEESVEESSNPEGSDSEEATESEETKENENSIEGGADAGWGSTDSEPDSSQSNPAEDNSNSQDAPASVEEVDNVEENVDNQSSSTATESTSTDEGWGSEVQSCNSNEECSEGFLCSNSGECVSPDSSGVSQIGDECNVADDCGIGLQCIENTCAASAEDVE